MSARDANLEIAQWHIRKREEIIRSFPSRVVELYNAARDGELAILRRDWPAEELNEQVRNGLLIWFGCEWNNEDRELTRDEYALIVHYMIASAFVASWYELWGETEKRSDADAACGFIIGGFNFQSQKVIDKYAEYRRACVNILRQAGVARSGNVGCLGIVAVLVGVSVILANLK
jgi:hypothetical protein